MTDPHFLDPSALTSHLGRHAPKVQLHLFDTIDSTGAEARRRPEAQSVHGQTPALYIARSQTGGRGRLGRTFYSPEGGLYMTLALHTDRPPDEAARLTPAAAVATAEAIELLTGKRADIKWVNDLYLGGGKLAGILTEAMPSDSGRTRLLIGIGINLSIRTFPAGLRAPAASLFSPAEASLATPAFFGALAGETVRRLLDMIACPDPAALLDAYRTRLLYVGERVTVTRGDESFPATVRGVSEDFSLLVEWDGTVTALSSGEISIRPKA